MLRSKLFVAAPARADFLKIVVELFLSGKETTEWEIGIKLVGTSFNPTNNTYVRVTASNTRETISRYYLTEGVGDPVIILLPKPEKVPKRIASSNVTKSRSKPATGHAYKPDFLYNPASGVHQEFLKGQVYLREFLSVPSIDKAITFVFEGFDDSAAYPPSLSLQAEGLMYLDLFSRRPYCDKQAQRLALYLFNNQPRFPLPRIILGFYAMREYSWNIAEALFEEALALDPEQTRSHPAYQHYLIVTGKTKEALALAKTLALQNPLELSRQVMFMWLLYLNRQYRSLPILLGSAITDFKDSSALWAVYLLMACLMVADTEFRDPAKAATFLARATELYGHDAWWGLRVLFLYQSEQADESAYQFPDHAMSQGQFPDILQTFFVCMAIGEIDTALRWLKAACFKGHAIGVLLPTLPLFDSVREHPQFMAMVARLNFPRL